MFRRVSLALLLLGLLPLYIHANEKRMGYCQIQNTGARVTGCTVTVYLNGTTTLAAIYSDNANTPLSNPFPANSTTGLWSFYATNGRYDVRMSGGVPSISPAYTLSDYLLLDADVTFLTSGSVNPAQSGVVRMAQGDCLAWRDSTNTIDNCLTENTSNFLTYQGNILPIEGTSPLSQGNCVQAGPNGTLTTIVGSCGTSSGTVVISGSPSVNQVMKSSGGTSITNSSVTDDGTKVVFSESIFAGNSNNIITVDGTQYTTFAAAFAACPPSGSVNCVIDMRGNSTALNIGSFDPGGTVPVTLLLGPYVYSVAQIALRSGLHIYGSTSGGFVGGAGVTILQSSGTTNPVMVLGGSTAVLGTHIEGLRIYCGVGNTTQIGINLVAQLGGGHWYSDWKDIYVGGDATHACGGGGIVYDGNIGGSTGNGLNQFITMREVRAFRSTNGSPALTITGLNGQFGIHDSQFDGPTPRDNNKVNILINDGTETFRAPYNFLFDNVTSQMAWGTTGVAVQLAGVNNATFYNCHFENDNGGIKATIGNTFGSWGEHVISSQFDTGTGIDSGNGFILSTDANSSVAFDDNNVVNTPDAMFAGSSIKYVSSKGNINSVGGVLQPAPANNRPVGGFDKDGPAIKHINVNTQSIGGGTRANSTVTWTTPFADNFYTVVCNVTDTTTATTAAGLVFERQNTIQTANGVTVTVFNPTGGAITGQLECIAVHD